MAQDHQARVGMDVRSRTVDIQLGNGARTLRFAARRSNQAKALTAGAGERMRSGMQQSVHLDELG